MGKGPFIEVYLLSMVIFHGELLNNQMVYFVSCFKKLSDFFSWWYSYIMLHPSERFGWIHAVTCRNEPWGMLARPWGRQSPGPWSPLSPCQANIRTPSTSTATETSDLSWTMGKCDPPQRVRCVQHPCWWDNGVVFWTLLMWQGKYWVSIKFIQGNTFGWQVW